MSITVRVSVFDDNGEELDGGGAFLIEPNDSYEARGWVGVEVSVEAAAAMPPIMKAIENVLKKHKEISYTKEEL